MEPKRTFLVKTHIVGGGLALREGQVVEEPQLLGYAEWLKGHGGVEELTETLAGKRERVPGRAFTA